jgi:catechol 2,3-dioxygenase-like lactoylglutathione lyase family enzyme
MPVSHVGLTVSDVPTSASFYLSALKPLGYRYIGQWGPQIGFGVDEADFFVTQEMPGMQAGGGHVAFAASDRKTVHEFFAAALDAGGRSHGKPAKRYDGDTCFNAAILDFDGNSIEVVYHEEVNVCCGSAGSQAPNRLLTWRDSVRNADDIRSVAGKTVATQSVAGRSMAGKSSVSVRSLQSAAESAARQSLQASSVTRSRATESITTAPMLPAPTEMSASSVLDALQKSILATGSGTVSMLSGSKIEISTRTLAGTLIGAAAGAAVAYAACKSEEDSARAELEASIAASQISSERYAESIRVPRPPSNTPNNSHYSRFQIEEAPVSLSAYLQPLSQSRAIEYLPSASATQVSTRSARRPSVSTGNAVTESDARTQVSSRRSRSKAPSVSVAALRERATSMSQATSKAPTKASSRLSKVESRRTSHEEHIEERSHSISPSHSSQRAKSETSRLSSSSKKSRRTERSESKASKVRSTRLDSVIETDSEHDRPASPPEDHMNFVDDDGERDTVVPGDSISNVGSRRSKTSKSSSKTKKTSCGGKSTRSSAVSSRRRSEHTVQYDEMSDNGSAETMTPRRYKERSAASLPIRGITPSMINGSSRTVKSYFG